jgi:phage terminase small subunit
VARQRNPNRDKAYQIWLEHKGDITNRQIAEMLGENEKVIAVWKQRDKWNVVQQSKPKVVQHTKKNKTKRTKGVEESVVQEVELTEKQRLFCLYYVKSFNATQAAIKAGYSRDTAHVQGPRLLGNVRVAEEIKRIKQDITSDLYIEALDVLRKYVEIAFADITDYVTFGKKEVKQMVGDKIKSFEVSFVDVKSSDEVDGTIIQEVKQSREGISIKLHDKMKALEKLEQYFDLLPDQHKRKLEEEKSNLDKKKYQLDKRIVELREREEKMKGW